MMILVTGAGGFIANHLIPRLVKERYQIRGVVTSEAKASKIRSAEVEMAVSDITRPAGLAPLMEGVDVIIHLAALFRETKYASYYQVNVEGTRNIIKAAQDAGIKRFIHMGILGATPVQEYRYLHSKWLGTQAVKNSGLDYSILEPSAMFGEGSGFIQTIVRSLDMFPFIAPIAGSGQTKIQTLWVEDAVECLLRMVAGDKMLQICPVGGPEILTSEQIISEVMRALGRHKMKLHVPIGLIKPAVGVMERVLKNPVLFSDQLKTFELDNVTALDSVERQFGFKPLPLRAGLGYLQAGAKK
jgi:nucleoside-diphosphate-sugar epimerase